MNIKPKVLIPMGSRIPEEEWTASSNQLIKANLAAGRPEIFQLPGLSSQVFERRNELAVDIRTQFGVTEQEIGQSPQTPNARAMAILEAEADQTIGPILKRNHEEWKEMYRAFLSIFAAFAHEDRTWSIVGPEGMQTYSFSEMNLKEGWDLVLEESDGMSRNPSLRLNQSMEMLGAGVFLDPMTGQNDMQKFLRHAKLNIPEAAYDYEMSERAKASSIPYKMLNGEMRQPQLWDEPKLYAEELAGWLRGPGEEMMKENPQVVQEIAALWVFYSQWAMSGMPPPEMMAQNGIDPATGQQSQPGQMTTGPGGTPSTPGGTTDVLNQAQGQVSQMDAQNEAGVRGNKPHEG